jgi:phosphatidylglycerophosphatase A
MSAEDPNAAPVAAEVPTAPAGRRPSAQFMLGHPARWIALGMGSGLSPWAPGTVGTLWSWVAFLALEPFLDDGQWLLLIAAGVGVGVWACTRTARELGLADPSCIVWDEIVAFWIVLLMIQPATWVEQTVAFALFRFFDAVKPPPVNWADQLFKPRSSACVGWLQGWGILFDDLVAAFCVVLLWALWWF